MDASGGSLKRTNPCTVINTRRILLTNIHKSPKMRDGLQKGASPSSIGLNILVNDFVDIPIARQSAGAGDLVEG